MLNLIGRASVAELNTFKARITGALKVAEKQEAKKEAAKA